jgi:hypothetical protein
MSDFSKIGLSSVKDSSAFKKIQYHSKSPSSSLFGSSNLGYSRLEALNSLYNNSVGLAGAKDYYTDRQDNYTSVLSSQLGNRSSLESNSLNKYLSYNFGLDAENPNPGFFNNVPGSNLNDDYFEDHASSTTAASVVLSPSNLTSAGLNLGKQLNTYDVNATSDGKYYNNAIRSLLSPSIYRKSAAEADETTNVDLQVSNNLTTITQKFSNTEKISRFKDLKSPNMGFLSSDKNSRLIAKMQSSKGQHNFSSSTNNLEDAVTFLTKHNTSPNESAVYSASNED